MLRGVALECLRYHTPSSGWTQPPDMINYNIYSVQSAVNVARRLVYSVVDAEKRIIEFPRQMLIKPGYGV